MGWLYLGVVGAPMFSPFNVAGVAWACFGAYWGPLVLAAAIMAAAKERTYHACPPPLLVALLSGQPMFMSIAS